jgi:hypothetical protein
MKIIETLQEFLDIDFDHGVIIVIAIFEPLPFVEGGKSAA